MHNHLARLLLFALLFSLFAGCAAKDPTPRFVWPPPPEQPRMEWKGVFYSDYSLKAADGESALAKFIGAADQVIMSTPFGIAADGQGKVYVSDIHKKNVWVFNFIHKTVELLSKNSAMQSPAGVALDNKGHIYVADTGRGAVWVYDLAGKALRVIGDKDIEKPAYVTFDAATERLFVSDGKNHKIHIFDVQGNLIKTFGEGGNGPDQLFAPQGMAIGPDGNLYIADMFNARVQIFDTSGQHLRSFGERGDQVGQFENPKDLAFDSDGNLHIIDGRNSNLMTFTPEGQLLLVTGTGSATTSEFGFGTPRSIFIDANDRIYIAEALGKRFALWQYMSKAYLQTHPYTQADRQRLEAYIEKRRQEQEAAAQ